jgi:hypothetical protein
MLKISLIDSPRRRRVIVEGKLIAQWAAELRNACQQASLDLRGRELRVEMKHVTHISQEAKNVILELINGGIKFRSEGVFTKHVMKELSRRARRNLGGTSRRLNGQISSSEEETIDARVATTSAELEKKHAQ